MLEVSVCLVDLVHRLLETGELYEQSVQRHVLLVVHARAQILLNTATVYIHGLGGAYTEKRGRNLSL